MKQKSFASSRNKAKRLLEVALGKKSKDHLALDLKGSNLIWDYFVIVTSTSLPHSRAILEELLKVSKEEDFGIHHLEKDEEGGWFLIDYFDIVFNIFSEEKRKFYDLERLFRKAKKVRFKFKNKI